MSFKSSIVDLASVIGKCQENSRSLKQALFNGLVAMASDVEMPWTLVKTETGTTAISLPDSFHEVYAEVEDNFHNILLAVYIPKEELSETTKHYRQGYYKNVDNNGSADITATITSFAISAVDKNGAGISSVCTLTVYAR